MLEKAGWKIDDVDLFQIKWNNCGLCGAGGFLIRKLDLDESKLSQWWWHIALEKPIGVSGVRTVATRWSELGGRNALLRYRWWHGCRDDVIYDSCARVCVLEQTLLYWQPIGSRATSCRLSTVTFALTFASTIAASIVHSKLDYCNSLYCNLPKSQMNYLQQIHNCLARTVVKAPKSSLVTPILRSLHWLKINERIEYKLLSLTYKVLTTSQPD